LCGLLLRGQKVSELNSEPAELGGGQIMPTTLLVAPLPLGFSDRRTALINLIPMKRSLMFCLTKSRRLDT
jgi:hypothetical protein